MPAIALNPGRLAKTKMAFTTRRVHSADLRAIDTEFENPAPGDLVLARVEKIGQHTGLQLQNGRRAAIHTGDEIIVAFGERYAPDQFEAEVGVENGQCHLIAAGGLAGRVLCSHARMAPATVLAPVGLIANRDGRTVNLRDYALSPVSYVGGLPVLAVLGTSMNAGKTTTAASLVRGLTLAGKRVGAAKVTGTGAGGDIWSFTDAGAHKVLDFTDAGHGSTYRVDNAEVEQVMQTVLGHLVHAGCDAIVMEVADGIFQRETAELMRSRLFRTITQGVVFAAGDAVSAVAGAGMIAEAGLPVIGVSGVVTRSPLACREFEAAAKVPVLSKQQLSDPGFAADLIAPTPVLRSA